MKFRSDQDITKLKALTNIKEKVMKQQFDLSLWLKNKSRKVETRDGKPVRIVCWDLKCNTPIIAAIQWNQEREDCYCYNTKGRCANNVGELDLFFANDKLTEFEKELQIIISEASHWTSDDGSISTYCQFGDKEIKKISVQILDLAKRELQPEFDKEMDKMLAETDKVVYQKGREDALKDLPKWKKITDETNLSLTLSNGEYYIPLEDLKTLPKEE